MTRKQKPRPSLYPERINLSLSTELYKQVEAIADARVVTLSTIAREAIVLGLPKLVEARREQG